MSEGIRMLQEPLRNIFGPDLHALVANVKTEERHRVMMYRYEGTDLSQRMQRKRKGTLPFTDQMKRITA